MILKQLFRYYLSMISIFFIGRLSLFIIYFDTIKNSDESYWLTFIYGLRMDTITASVLLVIPAILLTLTPKLLQDLTNIFLKYYWLIIISFLLYIEIATFPFIAQYDVRPNYLFVEYLDYPQEVFSMIFADYKIELSIAFLFISTYIYRYLKNFRIDGLDKLFKIKYKARAMMLFPIIIILFIGIRSSFGHRPANISDAIYSSNRILNEITKNSLHSIVYAIYVNKKYDSGKIVQQYGKMNINEAIQRVETRLNIKSLDKKSPLLRDVKTNFKTNNPKNLVIFIQESLGYQFVKTVGGEDGITPNFNKLSKEGILFKDLYSNGTRSIRGIAGVVSGNFSIPGKGVIKRNKSQKDYFTIAKLLKPFGYHTSFIYGGESRFDNMRGWFLGNGFDEVIDEPKFENPSFIGTWGVCDEDLIIRANQEYKKLYLKKKKFASVIFSTSNHTPFDFPDNKIDLIKDIDKKSVKNAVKYADFAIGKFIELAKKEKYYKNTIFVVIADHNVRVYGDDIVPVNMFHIPALILGKNIQHIDYDNISTQPDVLATALDLIGLDLQYPIMGNSIFSDKKQNLAFMQFNNYYALRVDNNIAILRPNKEPLTFFYKNKKLIKTKHNKKLEKDALAFIILLDYLYNKKLY